MDVDDENEKIYFIVHEILVMDMGFGFEAATKTATKNLKFSISF